jgi:hypothetical protein
MLVSLVVCIKCIFCFSSLSYTSVPPYVFMAQCLSKHRDNFILLYLEPIREHTNVLRNSLHTFPSVIKTSADILNFWVFCFNSVREI